MSFVNVLAEVILTRENLVANLKAGEYRKKYIDFNKKKNCNIYCARKFGNRSSAAAPLSHVSHQMKFAAKSS